MKKVSIIDYGLSNLHSVENAFTHFGVHTEFISSPDELNKSEVLVLPGVGAFEDGMNDLHKLNLVEPIRDAVGKGIPLLGICLGMQMLFDESEEFGIHEGLGLISGRVIKIPDKDISGIPQKIPHISWNSLYKSGGVSSGFDGTILNDVREGEECYFIHSYEAVPFDERNRLADTIYGGRKICAVAYNNNVYGTQFHPEKSGQVGLKIISRFIKMYCV